MDEHVAIVEVLRSSDHKDFLLTYGTLSSGMRELCHRFGWKEVEVVRAFQKANMADITALDDNATVCGHVGRMLVFPWNRLRISFSYSMAYRMAGSVYESQSRLSYVEISSREQREARATELYFTSSQKRSSACTTAVNDIEARLEQIYVDYPMIKERVNRSLNALLDAFDSELP